MTKPKTMETVKQGQFYDTHIPYAKLTGSTPYDIGHQHGLAAKLQISRAIEIYTKLSEDSRGVTWSVARSRAQKYLPVLNKHPDILQELQGVADGSHRDLIDILTLNVRSEITMVDVSDGCTSLAQRQTTTGDVFVGQNWDWIPDIDECTIWLDVIQEGKPRILFLAEAGIIGKYGYNNSGLAIMLNAIPANEVAYDKLPIHFTLRRALEQTSVDAAINYLNQNGCASCANLLMGDPKRWCTVEVSPKKMAVVLPDETTGVVSHTNHIVDEELAKLFPCDKPFMSSPVRYKRLIQLNQGSDASFESFRERLSDTENGHQSICHYPVPNAVGLGRCVTLYTIIVNTTTLEGNFTIGQPADNPTQYKLFFSD